jgi:hypothetical protein
LSKLVINNVSRPTVYLPYHPLFKQQFPPPPRLPQHRKKLSGNVHVVANNNKTPRSPPVVISMRAQHVPFAYMTMAGVNVPSVEFQYKRISKFMQRGRLVLRTLESMYQQHFGGVFFSMCILLINYGDEVAGMY